jgi:hypothetical protein
MMPYKQEIIDELVRKCKNYVFDEILFLKSPPDDHNYKIIHAGLTGMDDWSIILEMAYDPSRLYMFSKTPNSDRVAVSTHIRAHWFSVDNF